MNVRRVRLGVGAAMVAATALAAVLTPPPAAGSDGALAQATPLTVPGTPSPPQPALGGRQPTPLPLNTLAPLTGQTSLPYPAYGTPVPGINAGTPPPGIAGTVSLQQAIMIGFARSPALATVRNDVDVEAAAARLAAAGLYPSFSGSASYNYEHVQPGGYSTTTTSTGTSTGAVDELTTSHNASFGLALSQLIFDGGRLALAVHAANTLVVVTADGYRRELQTVAYNIAQAYYSYLAAERSTQVDLEIVREDQVQENLVRAQVAAGTAARSDIATVQLPVAQARLAVIRAQGTELAAEATFSNAMGLDANAKVQPIDDAPVFTATPTSTISLPSYDVALTRAVALRPDYDAAVQTVTQNQYSLRSARLGLFPTLTGNATANDASTNGAAGAFRNSQAVGVSLAVPIYDQGETAANVASAKANLNNAFANQQSTLETVQLSVKQALTGVVSARAAIDQTQQEYATAVVNLQATQAQYRAGVTTLPLLLNAQVQLTQALGDQVTAVYTLRQAEQTYLYAVGSNYDTSAQNGKRSVSPVPGRDAQGGKVAQKAKKKSGSGGTVFAR